MLQNQFIENRLFSFYEKDTKRNEWDMIIYLAGYGKGGSEISDKEYFNIFNRFNRLYSFYDEKMKLYLAGNLDRTFGTEIELLNNTKNRLISYNELETKNQGVLKALKLYLAGGEDKAWEQAAIKGGAKNSLYSYLYLKAQNGNQVDNFITSLKRNIFLDSGAYSAFTKGIKIDIDEYIEFIKKHEKILTTYACLDVIGNAKATKINQEYMESKGLNPLPCFHYNEDWYYLKDMVIRYKYIALGGMVPLSRNKNKLISFLSKCFSIIGNKKVHGFGITNLDLLKTFPFYSVDSTSWLSGSKRNTIYQFNNSNGTMKYIRTKEQNKSSYKTINFNDDENKKWMSRVINNAIEWQKVEKYITDLWTKRGVTWDE